VRLAPNRRKIDSYDDQLQHGLSKESAHCGVCRYSRVAKWYLKFARWSPGRFDPSEKRRWSGWVADIMRMQTRQGKVECCCLQIKFHHTCLIKNLKIYRLSSDHLACESHWLVDLTFKNLKTIQIYSILIIILFNYN
jgi:hypothetical protein